MNIMIPTNKEKRHFIIESVTTSEGEEIQPHSIDVEMKESPFSSYSECVVFYPPEIEDVNFGKEVIEYLIDESVLPSLRIIAGGVMGWRYELELPPDVHEHHIETYHKGNFVNDVIYLMDVFYENMVLLDLAYRVQIESEMMYFGYDYVNYAHPTSYKDAGGIVTPNIARNYFKHALSAFSKQHSIPDNIIYPPYIFVSDVNKSEAGGLNITIKKFINDYNDTINYRWQTYYLEIGDY